MTVEQAKEMLPFIRAYAEGKTIQYFTDSGYWSDIRKTYNPSFDKDPRRYRIKPDPKIRPFHDAEECWKEMWRHDPFGWIRWKKAPHNYQTLSIVANSGVDCVTDDVPMNFQEALDTMVFADGEPFGILEEEDEQ